MFLRTPPALRSAQRSPSLQGGSLARLTRDSSSLLSGPMIRRSHLVLLVSLAFVAACTSNPVGRVCDLGSGTTELSEVVIASPSLDCVSRTCLAVPLQTSLPDGSM